MFYTVLKKLPFFILPLVINNIKLYSSRNTSPPIAIIGKSLGKNVTIVLHTEMSASSQNCLEQQLPTRVKGAIKSTAQTF